MYHIAAEITMFGGLFYYVSKRNNDLRQQLYELEQDIEEIAETMETNPPSGDYHKAIQMQEKTKSEYEQVQTIKKQLSHDVQELQVARDKHNLEQKQIQQTYEEHIRQLQLKRNELEKAQSEYNKDKQALEQRERLLEQREKILKKLPVQQEVHQHAPTQHFPPQHQHFPTQQQNFPPPQTMQPQPQPSIPQNVHVTAPLRPSPEEKRRELADQFPILQQKPTNKVEIEVVEEEDNRFDSIDNDEIDDEIDAELQRLEEMDSVRSRHSKSKSKSKKYKSKSKSRRA